MTITWTGASMSGIEAVNGGGYANVVLAGTAGADTMDFSGVSLTGLARIDGGAGNDVITGSAGADTIAGGAGLDTLDGGEGSDTYLFSAATGPDSISDTGASGTDTLLAQSAATLVWSGIDGIEAVNGGGYTNVVLSGTAGVDTLDFSGIALTGVARIDGGAGNDVITGSAGSDTIIGGAGADLLTGGGGADTFRFSTGQSTVAAPDHITDFDAGDKIDLSLIDANSAVAGIQLFHWLFDAAPFVANDAGALRAYDDGLGHTIIEGNINADTTADFRIVLGNAYAIGSGDFIGL